MNRKNSSPPILILAMCLCLAAHALLLACAATPSPTAVPTDLPVPTVVQLPTREPVTLPDDVLVIFHKTGGIAGIDDSLTVHHGGLLELVSRDGNTKSLKINEPEIQQLRGLFEQKDFGEMESFYRAPGADLFTYTITANDSNGKPKTVTTMDKAKHPDFLGLLIVMLDQLRAIVAKNG